MKRLFRVVPFLIVLICGALSQRLAAQTVELRPTVSVVDYLKAHNKPSGFDDRKQLYQSLFEEAGYTGTAEQNVKLLARLVSDDEAAKTAGAKALEQATELAKSERDRKAEYIDNFACVGYVPVEGVGINGSYGFSTRIHVVDGKVTGKNVLVVVNSAAASMGSMEVTGTVKFFVQGEDEPIGEMKLQPAWFDTIGDGRSVARYGEKDKTIELPAGKTVFVEVNLTPVVTTTSGSFGLWGCTRRMGVTEE